MFRRQITGSVLCISCGSLVGVNDERCYNCGRRNPALWGYASVVRRLGDDMGFTVMVITGSVVLYLLSMVLSGGAGSASGGLFGMLGPSSQVLFMLGASGALPVFGADRWWTVLSAGWLHAGLLHLLFNMLWIRQLAPVTADALGAGRMVIIYTVGAIVGFTLSSVVGYYVALPPPFRGAMFTVGASAPLFGLLGGLICYGRASGNSLLHSQIKTYAIVMLLMGLVFPGVDNFAHAGGFLGGYGAALAMKPLAPERPVHVLVGLACLLATALAVIASVVHGMRLLAG
jgi:rhomboid protease GluP